jgi:hypothetical protein
MSDNQEQPTEEEYLIMIKPTVPPTFMPSPKDTGTALRAADVVLRQFGSRLTPHEAGAFNGAVARTIAPARVDIPDRPARAPKKSSKGGNHAA